MNDTPANPSAAIFDAAAPSAAKADDGFGDAF